MTLRSGRAWHASANARAGLSLAGGIGRDECAGGERASSVRRAGAWGCPWRRAGRLWSDRAVTQTLDNAYRNSGANSDARDDGLCVQRSHGSGHGFGHRHLYVLTNTVGALGAPLQVDVFDTAMCNAQRISACAIQHTVQVGVTAYNIPGRLALDQATDTVYVTYAGSLWIIDGATCNATVSSGCTNTPASVPRGSTAGPSAVAVDQATDTVYVDTLAADSTQTVSVINGATCSTGDTSGCGLTPSSVKAGTGDKQWYGRIRMDQATETLYVPNYGGDTVSMINAATGNATYIAACPSPTPL